MAEVKIQEGESIESALRRFKRKVQQEDIIKDIKKHSFYLKPGDKRRAKQALARKRNRKKLRRETGVAGPATRSGTRPRGRGERPMEFQDRILRCVDCGAEFIWTAGEQLFFADKNFKNEPKRCKALQGQAGSRPAGGAASVASASKRTTNCSACGKETTVPFRPDAGASGVLQGMLPAPEVRRGGGDLAHFTAGV